MSAVHLFRARLGRLWLPIIGAFVLALGSWASADAQTTAGGSIRGQVEDVTGAVVPGAIVVASSPSVAGNFRVLSDEVGNYRLTDLPPAEDFTVSAESPGFAKFERTGIIVRAGSNVRLDINLVVAGLTQSVEVAGTSTTEVPLIDTFSSEQSVAISGEVIRSLPLGGRREWSDTLQVTPGILSASTDNYGGQVYFVRGSENENHATLVDGADVGSFKQNWPSNYISISTESLGDVQVKTGANDASSPAAMGMVINIATPTGGDQYHGAYSFLVSPRSWNASNNPGGSSAVSEAYQPDFAFSGPIKRQKAWFFFSGRYIYRSDGIARTQVQLNDLRKVVPDFQPFDNEARGFVYVTNGTLQLNDRHKLFGLIQYDSRTQGGSVETQEGPFGIQQYGGGAYLLRLTSVWSQKFSTRIIASYNNKGQNDSLESIGGIGSKPSVDVYLRTQAATGGTLSGNTLLGTLNNAASRSLTPARKNTIGFDANYYVSDALGAHDLQAGIYLQPNLATWSDTYYANDGFTTEDAVLRDQSNPSLGYVPFRRRYVLLPNGNGVRTSYIGADDYAVYVQDRWAPSNRLSISPGLRVEWIAAQDLLFGVQTQASWNFAPRIGASYVLTSNQRHVIRGSWGRVTDIPNAGYFENVGSNAVATRDEYDLDLDGVFETIRETPASTRQSTNRTRDPEKRQGFVEEWIGGYRTQLPGAVTFDASWVNRKYKDRPATVEVNQVYDGIVWRGLVDPTQNSITLSTNNRWNWYEYNGLEFTATKQTQLLNIISTYTRAWRHIAGTWQPNDPGAIIQPNAFPNNGGVGTVRGSGANSLSTDTRNRSWQNHQFRAGVTWHAPWRLHVSSLLTLQSGIPSGPIVTTIAAPDPQYGPTSLVINGRTVSNPLSTTTRFAYATRSEGQLWTPWLKTWNARIGREFTLGRGQSVQFDLDIFNIPNAGAGQQFLGGNNNTNANFGLFQNIQVPRSGQVSVRVKF